MYRIYFIDNFDPDRGWVTEGEYMSLDDDDNAFETVEQAQAEIVNIIKSDPFVPHEWAIGQVHEDGSVTMLQIATVE